MIQSGVLLAIASYAAYAWADAIIKGLGHSLSIFEIGLAYTVVSLVPMLLAKPAHERLRDTFRFRHRWLMPAILVLRVISSVSVTYTFTVTVSDSWTPAQTALRSFTLTTTRGAGRSDQP